MSDNSIIIVDFSTNTVTHKDIESENYYVQYNFKTLKTTLKKAQKMQFERNPEYGIILAGNIK
ncbi:MAG: hypothetical protein AABY22_36215 [Nanoarchaeota archaeon]